MAQWHVDKPVIYAKGDSYFILIPGRVNKQRLLVLLSKRNLKVNI